MDDELLQFLIGRLGPEDDADLWRAVVPHVLIGLAKTRGVLVEAGRCSHWLRPHQTRWTAAGGFAWPTGYGGTAYARNGLPEFDWSVRLVWTNQGWALANDKTAEARPALRVAIPSRTTRHRQAAVHAVWRMGKKTETRFYGFRKAENTRAWSCVAESEWAEDRTVKK